MNKPRLFLILMGFTLALISCSYNTPWDPNCIPMPHNKEEFQEIEPDNEADYRLFLEEDPFTALGLGYIIKPSIVDYNYFETVNLISITYKSDSLAAIKQSLYSQTEKISPQGNFWNTMSDRTKVDDFLNNPQYWQPSSQKNNIWYFSTENYIWRVSFLNKTNTTDNITVLVCRQMEKREEEGEWIYRELSTLPILIQQ